MRQPPSRSTPLPHSFQQSAEYETVNDRNAAKAACAVNSTGYFASRVEAGYDSTIKIEHLRLIVDLDAAHAMVHLRPDPSVTGKDSPVSED